MGAVAVSASTPAAIELRPGVPVTLTILGRELDKAKGGLLSRDPQCRRPIPELAVTVSGNAASGRLTLKLSRAIPAGTYHCTAL